MQYSQHLFRILLHIFTKHFDDFINLSSKTAIAPKQKPTLTFRTPTSHYDIKSIEGKLGFAVIQGYLPQIK